MREPDPADGRAMLISASPDAVHRLEAVDRDRRRWLDEQLAEWTEADLRDFVGGLSRYNDGPRPEHLSGSGQPDRRVGRQEIAVEGSAREHDLARG